MKRTFLFAAAAAASVAVVSSCACNNNSKKAEEKTAETPAVPEYTVVEKPCVDLGEYPQDKDGYYVIFDGASLKGWRGYMKDSVPQRWTIEDGCLKFTGSGTGEGQTSEGGDLIFAHKFKNFRLEFDWKVAKGTNSGVFYLAQEVTTKDKDGNTEVQPIYISAPEYQVLDNATHPDALLGKDGNRQSASLYDMIPAKPQNFTGFGEWQTGATRTARTCLSTISGHSSGPTCSRTASSVLRAGRSPMSSSTTAAARTTRATSAFRTMGTTYGSAISA